MRRLLFGVLLLIYVPVFSQTVDSLMLIPGRLQDKYISKINKRSAQLNGQITHTTEKYLLRVRKMESKIKQKIAKIDPALANRIFADADQLYDQWLAKVNDKNRLLQAVSLDKYIGQVDKVETSIRFMEGQGKQWIQQGKATEKKLGTTLAAAQKMKSTLDDADDVKQFYLFASCNSFPAGLVAGVDYAAFGMVVLLSLATPVNTNTQILHRLNKSGTGLAGAKAISATISSSRRYRSRAKQIPLVNLIFMNTTRLVL